MVASVAEALSAYRQSALGAGAGMEPRAEAGPSFTQLLARAGADAVDIGRNAEKLTQAAVAGKTDMSSVIAAVANAELTLQTVVAVRDRMVQAYQEVARMPI